MDVSRSPKKFVIGRVGFRTYLFPATTDPMSIARRHRTLSLAALAFATAAGSSCTHSVVPHTWKGTTSTEPSARLDSEEQTHIVPDERLSFRLTALGLDAGELVMVAGRPGTADGHREEIIRSRAITTGLFALLKTVVDDVTTRIDLDTGKPLYHRTDTHVGDSDTEGVEVAFAPGQFEIAQWKDGDRKVETQTIPEGDSAFDLTSALMALRAWQAKPGDRASLYVLRSTMFWQTNVEFHGADSVKTKLGRFAAIRIDGVTRRIHRDGTFDDGKDARYFSMWFSDDQYRLPLLVAAKTDYGDIRMELTEYEASGHTVASRD